jgi:hypothetical protein
MLAHGICRGHRLAWRAVHSRDTDWGVSRDFLAQYRARKAAEASAKASFMEITGECTAHPQIVAAGDVNDAMREQLEFLIEHAGIQTCGCSSCQRYAAVRAVLMQVFENRPQVNEKKLASAA